MAGQPNIFKTSALDFIDKAPDDHNFEFFVHIHFLINKGIYKRFNAFQFEDMALPPGVFLILLLR